MKKHPLILVLIASLVVFGLAFFWNINMRDGLISNVLVGTIAQAIQEYPALLFGGFVSLVMALIAGSIALHRLLKPKAKPQP